MREREILASYCKGIGLIVHVGEELELYQPRCSNAGQIILVKEFLKELQ